MPGAALLERRIQWLRCHADDADVPNSETVINRTCHYDEAQGWLELGNLAEAEAALDRISPGIREQPAVLEMRFHICAQTDRWDEAYELGKDCLFIQPDGLNGPVLLAHALHKLGRSQEAYATLRPACDAFPDESGPPYNLAQF